MVVLLFFPDDLVIGIESNAALAPVSTAPGN